MALPTLDIGSKQTFTIAIGAIENSNVLSEALADTFSFSDSILLGIGLIFNEQIILSDGISWPLLFSESLNLTDAVGIGEGIFLSDTFTFSDSLAAWAVISRILLGDFLILTDHLYLFSALTPPGLSDTLALSDSLQQNTSGLAGLGDSFTFTDSVTVQLLPTSSSESLIDTLILSDSLQITLLSNGSQAFGFVDQLVYSDSVEVELKLDNTSYIRRYLNDVLGSPAYTPSFRSEVAVGSIDGINTRFTISLAPLNNSQQVFLDSLLQINGIDYTMSGNIIIFTVPPPLGIMQVLVFYTA